MIHKSVLSLESIDFQDKKFFDDLTAAIVKIRAAKNWKALPLIEAFRFFREDPVKEISQIIKKHTSGQKTKGLNINCVPNQKCLVAHVGVPYLTINHVLVGQFSRGEISTKMPQSLEAISKALKTKNVIGVVDIRNNAFGGFFSEIPVALTIDPICLMNITADTPETRMCVGRKIQLEPEEMAAALLHEVGHIATTFEYMNRVHSTNQSLAALANARTHAEADVKASIINLVADKEGLDEMQRHALAAASEADEVGLILYAAAVEKSIAELGDSVYDSTSIEYLADQYAARCGAGAWLAKTISKINQAFPNSTVSSLMAGTVSFISNVLKATGANSSYSLSIIGAADRRREQVASYDDPHTRINRIRDQVIQRLKDPTADDDVKAAYLADLQSIDELNKTIDVVHPGLFTRIQELFNPRLKMSNKFKTLQKDLERIGHNNLFFHAAKINSLEEPKS